MFGGISNGLANMTSFNRQNQFDNRFMPIGIEAHSSAMGGVINNNGYEEVHSK